MLNTLRIQYTRDRSEKKKEEIFGSKAKKKGPCGVSNNKELRDCIQN